jgi:flagellar motor switch protein FliN/FliY
VTALEQIAHLAGVPMDLEVQLSRTTMKMRDILGLNVGSVVKTERSAGENIDIVAGGKLIGSGEIVIIEENFGVRITAFAGEE